MTGEGVVSVHPHLLLALAARLVEALAEGHVVGLPGAPHGLHEDVHHLLGVVRGRSHSEQLLAARHCRVVDSLDVDAVLGHDVVGKLGAGGRFSHL